MQWTEVKIPGAQVLRLWPKGRVYARPKGNNPTIAEDTIGRFIREDALSAKKIGSPYEVQALQLEYDQWRDGVTTWFRENSNEYRADYFARARFLTINKHEHAVNEDHLWLISKIVHDRDALAQLLVLETEA